MSRGSSPTRSGPNSSLIMQVSAWFCAMPPTCALASPQPLSPHWVSMRTSVPSNDMVRPKSLVCCLSCGIGIWTQEAFTDLIFIASPCCSEMRRLRERERTSLLVCQERIDLAVTLFQQPNNVVRRAISQADPDYLWRWPMKNAEAMKVLILADDDQALLLLMLPNRAVGSAHQPHVTDMNGTWVRLGKRRYETGCQIFVEKKSARLISQQGHSPRGAHARRHRRGRRGCRRSSVVENQRRSVPRACRRRDMTRHRQ